MRIRPLFKLPGDGVSRLSSVYEVLGAQSVDAAILYDLPHFF
jgi:hypothetical protein